MTGTGTFELDPPTLEDMTQRWSEVVEKGWPYLVASPASDLSRVLGFAYAGQFRARAAYAKTFEDSVYVAPSAMRQGVGAALMGELLATLKGDGVREVLAVIGDSANQSSIQLHHKAGFRPVGVMRNVGFKFDRWLDVVIMQRSLANTVKA